MIARLWRTGLKLGRGEAYERFAREVSLPMFREQIGFGGCVMSRSAESGLVLTLWQNRDAIVALDSSPSYSAAVARINASGVLTGSQMVEIGDVHLLEIP